MTEIFEEKLKTYNYELYLLHKVSKAIKKTFNEEKILSIILTAITADCALGLSRAAVFYYDKEKNVIYGKKGIGPFNEQEATQIWTELSKNKMTLEEYFQSSFEQYLSEQKFPQLIKNILINIDMLSNTNYFKRVLLEGNLFHIKNKDDFTNLPNEIKELFVSSEIVISPLFSSKEIFGIIIADNAFHYRPITDSTKTLISLLSIQAGIALETTKYHNIVKQQYEELKELHNAVEILQDKIVKQERLTAIGKLSSYFIHEIKNPLVTIGGFAQRISKTNNLSEIHKDANIIFKEIMKIEQILNRFTTLTLLSPLKIEMVNLKELVEEVIDLFQIEITRKKIVVDLSSVQNISVKADKIQISEIFFNLISNSIENTINGTIKIYAEIKDPFIEISVKDTGKGIPKELLPYITEPFYSTKPGGLGLGLFIVSNIVETLNGKLEILSEEKKGTTVNIYIPIK
ncbi:MAG: GAF domain-containing sensor histidine kinase [Candidatus Omnitrophica bacterium]|nr:GAF domain-containing sensor histidine kinase [Candidatus Omnitrophota bacterium]